MIEITKEELDTLFRTLGNGKEKYEFSCLYIDEENIVSTDTKSISILKHTGQKTDTTSFFIHRDVVETALKVKGGSYFRLAPDTISCFKKNEHIVDITKRSDATKFVDYKRVIPNRFKEVIPFANTGIVPAVLTIKGIAVDTKRLPKWKEDTGFIKINDGRSPFVLEREDRQFQIIIMPIVDKMPIL